MAPYISVFLQSVEKPQNYFLPWKFKVVYWNIIMHFLK